MINRITSFIIFLLFSFTCITAQETDVISVGMGYSMQTYYKLSDGSSISVANDAWDICFSASGQQDAGVFINESASSTGVPIKLYLAPTTVWTDVITNTDQFVDSLALYNPELNWTEGAFNSIKTPGNAFDYGWGVYNPQNFSVIGNKIFVIKLRDGSFLKFQIVKLAGITYTFKYAKLDGSNEVEKTITKGNKSLIHFSFKTNELVDIPTNYDLVFQRYSSLTTAPNDPSISQEYMVTGVLSGPGVQVAKASGVDPIDVKEEDYSNNYSSIPSIVGHDWKIFDFTQGWLLKEDLAFFVKTKDGSKYKIVFIDFEGSGTGNFAFDKYALGTTSTEDKIEVADIKVYPNPFTDYIYVSNPGYLKIYDSAGRLVINETVFENGKVNVSNLQNGNFVYTFSSFEGKSTSGKLVK